MISKPILNVLSNKTTETVPIWLMRQAGRYLPEYWEVRNKFPDFIKFCLNPEAVCEVTLQPIERFGFDAAIIFSDILIVCEALGSEVKFVKNHGPSLKKIENEKTLPNIKDLSLEIFDTVKKGISITKKELELNFKNTALIGFAGSAFTIAAYMINGGSSNDDFESVRKFIIEQEKTFDSLIKTIIEATKIYIDHQVSGGIEVFKLFDSWAGVLPSFQFDKYVYQPNLEIIKYIREKHSSIKTIVFPRQAGSNISKFFEHDYADCIALDQFANIIYTNKIRGDKVIQGNLDNFTLAYGNKEQIIKECDNILHTTFGRNLIFNLGHGILPTTPIENVKLLVERVKNYGIK
ncbi:MAG: uroporphyrinogen decarboxylase [Alphaproteobacteria bacterium]|jgi:uroporphyrinogen decarboxylase|nr:uroporphyrinogen decarboxylase [Candidatus Jidaibacter sp.]